MRTGAWSVWWARAMRLRYGCVCLSMFAALVACVSAPQTDQVRRLSEHMIEFDAVVSTGAFAEDAPREMNRYHLLVWEGGSSAAQSLLRTRVTDARVLEVLKELGAIPGDALKAETWDQRYDPHSSAPDQVIEGPLVEITLIVPGREAPLTIGEFLDDRGGHGFEMRLGGHADLIPIWESGCVICLYSCPGSKIGNASYTVRDYVHEETRYSVRPGVFPADGTEVKVRVRLLRADP